MGDRSMVLLIVKESEQKGNGKRLKPDLQDAHLPLLEISPLCWKQKVDLREETMSARWPCHQQIWKTSRSPDQVLKALECEQERPSGCCPPMVSHLW